MRKDLAGKISDSELEVMKLLWREEASLSITEIRENLQRTKGWEPATIKTLVSRLVSKGAVRQEKRNVYYYSPLISEEEYGMECEGTSTIGTADDGSTVITREETGILTYQEDELGEITFHSVMTIR